MTNVNVLAEARERRGMSIPWLAVAAGVPQHVLEAAERDPRALNVEEAARVGAILGVDPKRVLEVPAGDDRGRVQQTAKRAAPEAEWRQAVRRAGVDVDEAFGGAA